MSGFYTSDVRTRSSLFLLLPLLLMFSFTGWCQQSSPEQDEVLTLEQAIALALSENHLVRVPKLDVAGSIPASRFSPSN